MFLLILLLPLVFTALMPRRWLSPWFATLMLGFGLCWLDLGRVNGGAADMFGMAFLVMLLLAVLAVGAGRVLFARVFRKAPAPEGNADAESHGVNLYFAGLAGAVIGAVLLFATLKLADAVWPSALALHLGVVAVGVLGWFLIPRVWPWPWTDHRVQVQTVFRWAVALCCAGALAWSLVSAHTKILAAQLSAQGQPYCLQSATPRGLQPVLSRLDLTGFAAWAGRGSERHARMALGSGAQTEWRHWSYRKADWDQESSQGVLTCQPAANQAQALPWWAPAPERGDSLRFWMAGVPWSVPWARQPTTYGDMPSFQYLPPSVEGMSTSEAALSRVNVRLCSTGPIHGWYLASGPGDQVRTLHKAYGLEEQEIVTHRRSEPHIQWLQRNAAGEVTSWAQCHAAGDQCHHAFRREGVTVEFTYPRAELPDWQRLEEAQWTLLRSFAPQGLPVCAASSTGTLRFS
jgi:hypothetical protein